MSLLQTARTIRSGLAQHLGPVMNLELRISGRQRRTFVGRMIYLLALTFYVVLVWTAVVERAGNEPSAVGITRMSEAGKAIILSITWFQFAVGLLASTILMSTAYSEELFHNRLPTLMASPLSFAQIVLGKYFSRLLQLLVLLLLGVPVMMIVRVFGGVPWGFILASSMLVLVCSLLTGAISMLMSVRFRQPYMTVMWSILVAIPATWPCIFWLYYSSRNMIQSGQTSWAVVAILFAGYLSATVALLARCVSAFTIEARRSLGNDPTRPRSGSRARSGYAYTPADPSSTATGARVAAPGMYVRDSYEVELGMPMKAGIDQSPLIWKGMRRRFLSNPKSAVAIVVLFMLYVYGFAASCNSLRNYDFHMILVNGLLACAAVAMAVMAGSAITSEKEMGYWPLLLLTPQDEWQLLKAKLIVLARRSMIIWCALGAHLLFFTLLGMMRPWAILCLLLILAWTVALLAGLGVYLSTILRRTSTAVIATLGVAAGLWGVLPFITYLLGGIMIDLFGAGNGATYACYIVTCASPFVQAKLILEVAIAGDINSFVKTLGMAPVEMLAWLMVNAILFGALAVFLGWRAMRNFRRHAF